MKYEVVSQKYMEIVEQIRSYFADTQELIWDKRNKIKILDFNTERITIKSFKIPHMINRIAYTFFRDSKAKKSYLHSLKIADFVPQAIGYATFKKYGLHYDSYFLSAHYAYDFTIREVLTQSDFPDREIIFDAFAAFTYALHEAQAEHLDYSPGNILIKKLSDGYEFKTIDVNRMKFRALSAEERVSNFSKLWADDSDLQLIIHYYAKYAKIDEKIAQNIALKALHAHKAKKNLKKRLKGKKVVS